MRTKSYQPGINTRRGICDLCTMQDCTNRPAGYELNPSAVASSPEEPYSTCKKYNPILALKGELGAYQE